MSPLVDLIFLMSLGMPDSGLTGTLIVIGNSRDGLALCADVRQRATTGAFRDDDVKFKILPNGSVLFSSGTTKIVNSDGVVLFDADAVATEALASIDLSADATAHAVSVGLDAAFRRYLASRPRTAWVKPGLDPFLQVGVLWQPKVRPRTLVISRLSYNPAAADPVNVRLGTQTLPEDVTWLRAFGNPATFDRVRDLARNDRELRDTTAPFLTPNVAPDTVTSEQAEAALRAIIAAASRFDSDVSAESGCLKISNK